MQTLQVSYLALLGAIVIAFLWGVNPFGTKIVLRDLPYELVLIISGLCYFSCIIALCVIKRERIQASVSKLRMKHVAILLASSILTAFIPNLIFVKLLKHNPTYIITALSYIAPVFTLIIAALFLHEKVTWQAIVGVVFIVFGAGIICFTSKTVGNAK